MKFYKNLFFILTLILQPVILQCPVEAESHENLVDTYTKDESQREQYTAWYHKLLNNKKYTAAHEAQKKVDDTEIERLQNNETDRTAILKSRSWWDTIKPDFLKSRSVKLAERAQNKLAERAQNKVDERAQNKVDERAQNKVDEIKKIADEFKKNTNNNRGVYLKHEKILNTYSNNELISLAASFEGTEKVPKYVSSMITEKFIHDPKGFPQDGVKYLNLTPDVILKLASNKNFLTDDIFNSFLEKNPNELMRFLLGIRKNLSESESNVPKKLQDFIDMKYQEHPEANIFKKNKDYISKEVLDEVAQKRAEEKAKADEKAKRAARKKAEADKQSKEREEARKAEAKSKNEARRKSAQDAADKVNKQKPRAETESKQKQSTQPQKTDQAPVQGTAKYSGQQKLKQYFLGKKHGHEDYTKLNEALEAVGFEGILDQKEWRRFYFDKLKIFHPDKNVNETEIIRKQAEEKSKQLTAANGYLEEFYKNK